MAPPRPAPDDQHLLALGRATLASAALADVADRFLAVLGVRDVDCHADPVGRLVGRLRPVEGQLDDDELVDLLGRAHRSRHLVVHARVGADGVTGLLAPDQLDAVTAELEAAVDRAEAALADDGVAARVRRASSRLRSTIP